MVSLSTSHTSEQNWNYVILGESCDENAGRNGLRSSFKRQLIEKVILICVSSLPLININFHSRALKIYIYIENNS